ncbi:hypothetical protein KM043_007505 [Ampulex compressa]|nr:hypothetical protein KM043_007505 [Ampulex compressa]
MQGWWGEGPRVEKPEHSASSGCGALTVRDRGIAGATPHGTAPCTALSECVIARRAILVAGRGAGEEEGGDGGLGISQGPTDLAMVEGKFRCAPRFSRHANLS